MSLFRTLKMLHVRFPHFLLSAFQQSDESYMFLHVHSS